MYVQNLATCEVRTVAVRPSLRDFYRRVSDPFETHLRTLELAADETLRLVTVAGTEHEVLSERLG